MPDGLSPLKVDLFWLCSYAHATGAKLRGREDITIATWVTPEILDLYYQNENWRKREASQPNRRRSHDRHPDLNLQQNLEDREMADHIDSIFSCHTQKEKQLAAVPELQNHQPYKPS